MAGRVVPFRAPARRRLHEDVAEQLRDAILDGRFAAGTKLPPERELAAEFGVNRTSVREALKVLEGLGLVAVRQGDGATVRPLVDASLDVLPAMVFHGDTLDGRLLAELTEVVIPLLLEMGRLAIARRRPADLEAIRRLRDVAADAGIEREARFAALRDLLVVLADMSRNRVWQMLARRTARLLAAPPLRAVRERLRRDPAALVALIDAALAALDRGRDDEALRDLQGLIRAIGDPGGATRPARPHSRARGERR